VNVEKAFTTLSNEIKSKVQSKPGGQPQRGGQAASGPSTQLTKNTTKKEKSGCC